MFFQGSLEYLNRKHITLNSFSRLLLIVAIASPSAEYSVIEEVTWTGESSHGWENVGSRSVDNSCWTYWTAKNNVNSDQWLIYDIAADVEVVGFQIYTHENNQMPLNLFIERGVSSSGPWTRVGGNFTTTIPDTYPSRSRTCYEDNWQRFTFTLTKARYWRLNLVDNQGATLIAFPEINFLSADVKEVSTSTMKPMCGPPSDNPCEASAYTYLGQGQCGSTETQTLLNSYCCHHRNRNLNTIQDCEAKCSSEAQCVAYSWKISSTECKVYEHQTGFSTMVGVRTFAASIGHADAQCYKKELGSATAVCSRNGCTCTASPTVENLGTGCTVDPESCRPGCTPAWSTWDYTSQWLSGETSNPCYTTETVHTCGQAPPAPPPTLACTSNGEDMWATGGKLQCCDGLVEVLETCRGTDTCHFCQADGAFITYSVTDVAGYCLPWGSSGGDLCEPPSAALASTCSNVDDSYYDKGNEDVAKAKCNGDSACTGYTKRISDQKVKLKGGEEISGAFASSNHLCYRKASAKPVPASAPAPALTPTHMPTRTCWGEAVEGGECDRGSKQQVGQGLSHEECGIEAASAGYQWFANPMANRMSNASIKQWCQLCTSSVQPTATNKAMERLHIVPCNVATPAPSAASPPTPVSPAADSINQATTPVHVESTLTPPASSPTTVPMPEPHMVTPSTSEPTPEQPTPSQTPSAAPRPTPTPPASTQTTVPTPESRTVSLPTSAPTPLPVASSQIQVRIDGATDTPVISAAPTPSPALGVDMGTVTTVLVVVIIMAILLASILVCVLFFICYRIKRTRDKHKGRALAERLERKKSRVTEEQNRHAPWDFFLSHTQRNQKAVSLAADIYHSMLAMGYKVWLDVKMDDRSSAGMEHGVRNSKVVLAILTGSTDHDHDDHEITGYFSRPLCCQELRWALQFGAFIQPIVNFTDKPYISELIAEAPPDLKCIANIDFIDINRSDPEYFHLGMEKLARVLSKVSDGEYEVTIVPPSTTRTTSTIIRTVTTETTETITTSPPVNGHGAVAPKNQLSVCAGDNDGDCENRSGVKGTRISL